ncbi:putative transcriptional regulatory protein [Lachnellula arida]|uniref:Putative transcriptional regulatory protein n=1 Tax=Lachnellula arida TaxID=1316785 RepID=A0A8T9B9W5_9HELO|nr:putative transcriptional regulatory protein [Lachnellula arida]
MNMIEEQVTDLNYLAESPLALAGNMNGHRQSSSAESPAVEENGAGSGKKRRSDDMTGSNSGGNGNGATHTRAKRNRYISIAWSAGAKECSSVGRQHPSQDEDQLYSISAHQWHILDGPECPSTNGQEPAEEPAEEQGSSIDLVLVLVCSSSASNECKRRKIKCNGNTPCQRCGNLNLDCQYAPNCCTNGFKESEEFRHMNSQIASLQEQVDDLYANLSSLRSNGEALSFPPPQSERSMSMSQTTPRSPHSNYRSTPRHPSYRGPTSSAFSMDVAKTTLHKMGYQGLGDEVMNQDATPIPSPPAIQPPSLATINGIPHKDPTRDPLLSFSKEEMTRLCRVYEEEMGIMYPVVNIEQVIIHGANVYNFINAAFRTGLTSTNEPGRGINDEQSVVLKMVLACAAAVEDDGQSEIGNRLFESVKEIADRYLSREAVEMKNLPFLTLVAIYHFHCDEEALAWRIIGQVARMSIELGIHRRDSLFRVIPDEEDRSMAIKLFWSLYVLDRRWSFGTGMPFALQDADIDPNLPEPDIPLPYLKVMIAYSRIGSKVWRSVCSFSPTPSPPVNVEEIGYLDYQILQWQKGIPLELQLPTTSAPQTSSRAVHRLQIILYLRANQMRILIYRPVLHTASSIQENLAYAQTVVELAKDTIRAITHLNRTTDIYRRGQVCFNYFLTSAIGVIFLASCHAPVHFSSICREEFYMALDLVKGFSNKSFVSKRLWKTIKGLKEVGPKLGLSPDIDRSEDPHSSAALAMAGLAGHEISGLGNAYEGMNGMNGNGSGPNGFQMSLDMTSLFEAALGSARTNGNGNGQNTGTPYNGNVTLGDGDVLSGIGSNVFGGDEELYNQMKDLF